MNTIIFMIVVLATENLSDILTGGQPANERLFRRPRAWIGRIPGLGKIATCKYCQCIWIANLFVLGLYIQPDLTLFMAYPLAIHRACQFVSEAYRILGVLFYASPDEELAAPGAEVEGADKRS